MWECDNNPDVCRHGPEDVLSLIVHSFSAAAVLGGHRESWAPLGKLSLKERTARRSEFDSSEVAEMGVGLGNSLSF